MHPEEEGSFVSVGLSRLSILTRELRDLIYEYCFVDCGKVAIERAANAPMALHLSTDILGGYADALLGSFHSYYSSYAKCLALRGHLQKARQLRSKFHALGLRQHNWFHTLIV